MRDKFEKKGRRCDVIGYLTYQKTYRLYDLETHTTFVSRDVKFFKNSLPFNISQPSTPMVSFFPIHPTVFEDSISTSSNAAEPTSQFTHVQSTC